MLHFLAVLIIRQAISPRSAINNVWNMLCLLFTVYPFTSPVPHTVQPRNDRERKSIQFSLEKKGKELSVVHYRFPLRKLSILSRASLELHIVAKKVAVFEIIFSLMGHRSLSNCFVADKA